MTVGAKLGSWGRAITRGASRKMAAAMAALLAATTLTVVGAPEAAAANRDWLRPDATGNCDWDASMYWVQRCDVYSPAMKRNIPVLVQPAQRGGDAALYLLDGMRADDNQTGWTMYSDAPATYENSNLTLVMPIGGAGSFYTDWVGNASFSSSKPVVYMWETFLTRELPAYLQQHFGVNPHRNSIGGLSMGATAAMTLAAKHPDQFQQVLAFSGYLNTTAPGMGTLLRLALIDTGGFNLSAMYGVLLNPRRFEDDPYWNMEGLRGKDVYISSASGLWGPADASLPLFPHMMGTALEVTSRVSTRWWEAKARAIGLNPTIDYVPVGVHNWWIWTDQLHKTRDRVLDVMNAH